MECVHTSCRCFVNLYIVVAVVVVYGEQSKCELFESGPRSASIRWAKRFGKPGSFYTFPL